MKNLKKLLCIFITLSLLTFTLTACNESEPESEHEPVEIKKGTAYSDKEELEENKEKQENATDYAFLRDFSPSRGIDGNGFWEGIRALDYVEMFDISELIIPAYVHTVSDDDINYSIEEILGGFPLYAPSTERAVEDGDVVNIDFVGSVDGVEFENGSTEGMGYYVVIGETDFIDNFIEQLIGRMPGETFDVHATFPDEYFTKELQGADAVFVTTINFIEIETELNDDYVAQNLSDLGWTTVDEMKTEVKQNIQRSNVLDYLRNDYFAKEITVNSIPEEIIDYQKMFMLDYYYSEAEMYGMSLEELITEAMGISGIDELIELEHEGFISEAKTSLIIQAVAEHADIVPNKADISRFLKVDDFSDYEEFYGLPYLMQFALNQLVMDYIVGNAVLA